MSSFDVFGMTDKLPAPVLDAIVARLESRGKHPLFQNMLHEYLDAMAIDSTQTVLDVGCGTGIAARNIVRRPQFTGNITGIDLSPYLLEVAQRLTAEEGFPHRIDFRVGDSRTLHIPDQAFDAVVAHTLMSHVDNPLAVVQEAARVVKRGGLVGFFDGDYASLTFSHPDPAQGKAYDEAIQQAVVTNPRVMRQLPGLLRAAGLELVRSFAYVLAEMGRADFWVSSIESLRRLIPQAGVLSAEEINAWADARLQESAEGTFFGASNYYSYVAKRL
jgi:ubiquinone/menaquinone biosynthesis C-methylase UbiE